MAIEDYRVVVIGGASGIGEGIAAACAARGARVTLVGRTRSRLEAARSRIGRADLELVEADATREDDVARLFEGRELDHVVMTAVSASYAPVRQLELAAAQRTIDSKLVAALLVAKHARFRGAGSLTFTGGVAETRAAPGGCVVAAVNGAIAALARALSIELSPVRVNVLSPGWVDTPIWDTLAGANKTRIFEEHADRLPVKRVGTVGDLAAAALFLMQNGFVTGEVLHVDGGHRWV